MDKIVIYVIAVLVLLGGLFLIVSPLLASKTPSNYLIRLIVDMDYTNNAENIKADLWFTESDSKHICGSSSPSGIPCTLRIEGPVNLEITKDFDIIPRTLQLKPGKYKLIFDEYSDGKIEAEFDFNIQRTVYLKEPFSDQVIEGTNFNVIWDERDDENNFTSFWYVTSMTDKSTNFGILGKIINNSKTRQMEITLSDYYGEYFEAKRPLCRSHQVLYFDHSRNKDIALDHVEIHINVREYYSVPITFDYWIPQEWYKQQKGGENKTAKQWLIDSGQGTDCFNDE